jgi:hypothetical protein
MLMLRIQKNHKLDQRGFASIVIALVLILVVALLTVGFAQLARREQQNSLNKQLASQATYAAESGINDAYKDMTTADPATGIAYINKDNDTDGKQCLTPTSSSYGSKTLAAHANAANPNVDQAHGVLYTCLLVDVDPPNLTFDNVPSGSGEHATFSTDATLNTMTIQWGSASQNGANSAANHFPGVLNPGSEFVPQASWRNAAGDPLAPVVAFSITPLSPNTNRTALINNTYNVYLYPAINGSGGASCVVNINGKPSTSQCVNVNTSPGGQGQVVSGACSSDRSQSTPCSVTLTGLNGNMYLIHFSSFYSNSPPNLFITGTGSGDPTDTLPGSGPVNFTGEPQVDVTGKAKDVVKRVRARFLINGTTGGADDSNVLPGGSIEAQDLCKRLQTEPLNTTFNPGGAPCDLEQHNP